MRYFALLIFIFSFVACNQTKPFDKAAWKERGDLGLYPTRNKMLNYLIKNHKLNGSSYRQLIDLLGERDQYSDTEPKILYYNIVTDYGRDIDPVYTKNLKIMLNADSIATNVNLEEIKH